MSYNAHSLTSVTPDVGIHRASPTLIFPTIPIRRFQDLKVHEFEVVLTPIDTIAPRIVEPVVFAYSHAPGISAAKLKRSLASMLNFYTEWTGKIKTKNSDKYFIDLTANQGVVFIEAEANHDMREHMQRDHGALEDLMPVSMSLPPPSELLHVQMTRFKCGGIALGLGRHHYVTDAYGFIEFLHNWALSTRGLPLSSQPVHDRSQLMPRRPSRFEHKEYPVIRYASPLPSSDLARVAFNFSPEGLDRLVRRTKSDSFTVTEALYAHIWKSLTLARDTEATQKTMLLCPINGRRTLGIPDTFVGNVVFPAITEAITAQDLTSNDLAWAAELVKMSIEKTDNEEHMISAMDYVSRNLQPTRAATGKGRLGYNPNVLITGWIELPWYDIADFGFGRPVFAGPIGSHMEGVVRVVPGPKAGELVVTATMQKHDMVQLRSIGFNIV